MNWFVHVVQVCSLVYIAHIIFQFELPGLTLDGLSERISIDVVKSSIDASYGRLVFVMVDALREDFVHDRDEMNYARKLIKSGNALSFVSTAQTPTVTMPRIKAMTTGRIPKFMDILHNLDSNSLNESNIITELKHHNYRLSFFGDETWLKLFPEDFSQTDGTTSFFASDFYEVDNNVSRHINTTFDPTFNHEDSKNWDGVFMHYLGLDHIGHKLGPNSATLNSKLLDMDADFETIHRNLIQQQNILDKKSDNSKPTLLILVSDHGMNEAGNHGGSSYHETSSFLMLVPIGHAIPKNKVQKKPGHILQIDLAPTLACLYGLPIPANSIGRVIKGAFTQATYSKAVKANAEQFLNLLKQNDLNTSDLENAFKRDKEEFLGLAQQVLLKYFAGTANSDMSMAYGSVLVMFLTFLYFALKKPEHSAPPSVLPSLVIFLHPLVLTSSSMIENEHAYWYFCAMSVFLAKLTAHSSHLDILVGLLIPLRMIHSRSQIINFSKLIDASNEPSFLNVGTSALAVPEYFTGSVLLFCSFFYLFFQMGKAFRATLNGTSTAVINGVSSLYMLAGIILFTLKVPGYDTSYVSTVARERLVLLLSLLIFCSGVYISKVWIHKRYAFTECYSSSLLVLILLLHRTSAVFLLTLIVYLCRYGSWIACSNRFSLKDTMLISWIVGQCAFFALGNSHSISTVDISGAYTGLESYNAFIVGFFTTIITFSGPILSLCYFLKAVKTDIYFDRRELAACCSTLRMLATFRITVLTVLMIFMKDHLFVWSVFAPKWLYELVMFAFQLVSIALLDFVSM